MKEIPTIEEWLHVVSYWAPHQREAVEQSAQDKAQTRQLPIMDFALGALQTIQTTEPSAHDAHKPAGEV